MRLTKTIKPTDSLHGLAIDARVTSRRGKELAELITSSVRATQVPILTPLPSRLILTQQQFASLNDYTEEMYQTTDRMYVTPYGVMEIQIDREIDLIPELDEVIQLSEDALNETTDTKPNIILS